MSQETLGLPKQDEGIGFRNPKNFNLVLLAKQCWRLIHSPDSLWAQVIKQWYFPDCSFFEARKMGQSSWAWASLLAGKDIIVNGAYWQVLNDEHTRVWADR